VFEAADEPDDEFVFGLDRILDGVGALVSRLRLVEVVALGPGGGQAGGGLIRAGQADDVMVCLE
jgi:hypothetical protein